MKGTALMKVINMKVTSQAGIDRRTFNYSCTTVFTS